MAARLHEVGGVLDDFCAFVDGEFRPRGLRGACGGDRGIGVGDRRARPVADELRRARGIGRSDPFAAGDFFPADDKRPFFSKRGGHACKRGAQLVAVRSQSEVGVRRVAEDFRLGIFDFRFRRNCDQLLRRIGQQLLACRLAKIFLAEKPFVARVLEQAADEVSHAGQQLTDGAILPHAVAAREQRSL